MNFGFSRKAADDSLSRASYDPKKLTLLHMGASLAVNLLLLVLNFLVNRSIDSTTGLDSLGNRAVLSTLQSVLTMTVNIAMPFWQLGLLYAALRLARNQDARPLCLLEGFRRFRKGARLFILQLVLIFGVVFISLQVGSILFSFTPGYADTLRRMQELLDAAAAAGATTVDETLLMELLPDMIPAYVIGGVVLLILGVPLFYRFRMAQFALMDDAPGARKAMVASARMMRGNRWSLFKLDLSLCWYFLGQLAIGAVAYLDVLLPAVGVQLPVSSDVLFFGAFLLYGLLQLGFAWAFTARVQTVYAHCYYAMKAAVPPAPQVPQMPQAPTED